VHGEEDDLGLRIVLAYLARRSDPIENGHANVGDDEVRFQLLGRLNQRSSILDRAHNLKPRPVQNPPQALQDHRMIIGKKYSAIRFHRPSPAVE
jgi:hypothetical protein